MVEEVKKKDANIIPTIDHSSFFSYTKDIIWTDIGQEEAFGDSEHVKARRE